MAASVRVDKWLWSVRIFKSRSISATACKSNHVHRDGKALKPSAGVEIGDRLEIKKNGYNYEIEVLKLIEKRVGAPIAVECYKDHTPAEELNKFESWFVGKASAEKRERGAGRPTKKERREITDFKYEVREEEDDDLD